ncbi:MAG TPA: hypothetical protein VHE55_05200 [Fimbriimonadaceae bacterium]|nr:hypothetical protein [Fimbriimonadaceae bacterium]
MGDYGYGRQHAVVSDDLAARLPVEPCEFYTGAMTLREGGILVARGIAMVFLAQTFGYCLNAIEYTPGLFGHHDWEMPMGYFASAALMLLLAGFLWRGAPRFTSDLPDSSPGPPIDQWGLLRVLIAGIAVYWLFGDADKLVMLATTYMTGGWQTSYRVGLYRDIVMALVAGGVLVWAAKGVSLSRLLSYPRSEPDEER